MKCAIALVVLCGVASQAQPFFGLGSGLGLGRLFGNFMNGGGYGNNMYDRGMAGQANQGYLNSGVGGFHNFGGHDRRLTNIQQAEDTGFHNIGGGGGYTNGGYGSNGYNGYNRGGAGYGNNYAMGGQGGMFL